MIVFYRPLPPDDLATIIHEACGDDSSTAMLTQVCEILLNFDFLFENISTGKEGVHVVAH